MLTSAAFSSIEDVRRFADAVLSDTDPAGSTALRLALEAGLDPLGDAWIALHSLEARRAKGETYTPPAVVNEMLDAAAREISPQTVVDCGCGSGRFALACARRFPKARVIAVDASSDAVLLTRANVHALGLEHRIEVLNEDFIAKRLTATLIAEGPVLWIGNPPYVRHHDLGAEAKEWWRRSAAEWDLPASGLAGLHLYFLLAAARRMRAGDFGLFVTSAEWLDVNYGTAARRLLTTRRPLRLLRLYDPKTKVFEGVAATALVFGFASAASADSGEAASVRVINAGLQEKRIPLSRFAAGSRWSRIVRGDHEPDEEPARSSSARPGASLVPLGSFVRVSRGVVTGMNAFWVRPADALCNAPASLTTPIVSRARELMGDDPAVHAPDQLKRLITLPEDLSILNAAERRFAEAVIREGLAAGVDQGYVARHRRVWWSVRTPEPAPVLMTYMVRKRPTFVMNRFGLPMLNVVHGLYPKGLLSERALEALAAYLNAHVPLEDGRMYAGGLVKFEPREAEAILVPPPEALEAAALEKMKAES